MQWYEWALLAIAFLAVAFVIIVGFIGAKRLYHPGKGDLAHTRRREEERSPGLMAIYDTWPINEYDLASRHGYRIRVYHVPAKDPSKNYVVLAHGYSYSHHGVVKYAKLMRRLGFNIIMFDERYHGASGGRFCGMGYYEQDDVADLITDTIDRYGEDITIGTYGESMGGAAVILEQAKDRRVRFVVTDCTFADLRQLMLYQVKKTIGLWPQPFVAFTNLFFRAKTKVWLRDVSPIAKLKEATCPMLFMHGEDDTFVPASHCRMLYEACPTEKDLYIGGNHARHTDAVRYNETEYLAKLKSFFSEKVKLIDGSEVHDA